MKPASVIAEEIAAAAARAKEEEARMRGSYSTKYGYPFWGLRKLDAPVDLLAEDGGHLYKFFTSLFGTKYTYHPKYGWSTGINYTTTYRDVSGAVVRPPSPGNEKGGVESAVAESIPTETPAAATVAVVAPPILLPKPHAPVRAAVSQLAQAPPPADAESSPPSQKELDQAVGSPQEPTSGPEPPQTPQQGPQTPPAEVDRSLSQSPEASSAYSESDEAESQSDQAEEEQDQSAQDGSSSR